MTEYVIPMMGISLDDYQHLSNETAVYPRETALQYLSLGLASEAGEVAGKIAKYYRRDEEDFPIEDLVLELGDVLWFVSELASLIDVNLSEVAEENLEKLRARQASGTLKGTGDHR